MAWAYSTTAWLGLPLIAMLVSGPAPASQVAQVLNQFNFVGNHGIDGQVSSTLDCGVASCSVYDSLEFFGVDAAVHLVWTRADGSILLSGQVPWDFSFGGANTSIGRTSSRQYIGFLAGQPTYSQLTGKADFRNSITINPPCFGFVCDQDYLELPWAMPNPLPNASPLAAGTERRAAAQPADAGAQLGTTWTLADLQVPAGSPYGTVPTAVSVFSFSSLVERVGSDYRYSYAVTNPSDGPIDFSFDHFVWAGKLDSQGSSTFEWVSPLPPALESNLGSADLGNGRLFAGRLDILTPVPELQSWLLMGLGLGCVALAIRRRGDPGGERGGAGLTGVKAA